MLSYNSKEWFGIFRLHKAETFQKLAPFLAGLCGYTALIVFLGREVFRWSSKSHISGILILHTLLGFAISMLLVFRTNTAYDRWWEGRRLWGSLVNGSRNLAVKLDAFLPADDLLNRSFFAQLIPQFALALKAHLQSEQSRVELDERPHPEIPDFDTGRHVPTQVAGLMFRKTQALLREGKISGEQLIVLNPELTAFLDICGACERIRNTPIPFSYSAFIKKFIFVYVVTMPLGMLFTLGYIAIPVVAFIFYVLASLELIAEEIEEPFGKDSNDLPLERLCQTIGRNIKDVLEPA